MLIRDDSVALELATLRREPGHFGDVEYPSTFQPLAPVDANDTAAGLSPDDLCASSLLHSSRKNLRGARREVVYQYHDWAGVDLLVITTDGYFQRQFAEAHKDRIWLAGPRGISGKEGLRIEETLCDGR